MTLHMGLTANHRPEVVGRVGLAEWCRSALWVAHAYPETVLCHLDLASQAWRCGSKDERRTPLETSECVWRGSRAR
jgi:hypothetical protein